MRDAEFFNEYLGQNRPFFWEIVRPEWILTGYLSRDEAGELKVDKLKVTLFGMGEPSVVEMKNETLEQILIDDYKLCQLIKKEHDEAESWRDAK